MLENTDSPDNLALFHDSHLAAFSRLPCTEITRIADDLLRFDNLVTTSYANKSAIGIRDDLVDGLVEHVCTTIDCTEPGKGLGKFPEPIEGINIRGFAVTCHGRGIQNYAIVRWASGLGDITRGHQA